MRDDFDAQIADRFAVLVDVPVPDTWSRVQSRSLDPTAAPHTEEQPTIIDLEATTPAGDRTAQLERRQRPWVIGVAALMGAAAAIAGVIVLAAGGKTLSPADSVPPSAPSVSVPSLTSVPVDSVPVVLVPATVPTSTTAVPSLWVELEPGATTPLPPAPIRARNGAAVVWTGTELIVWGGIHEAERFDDGSFRESQEGAAFAPATGTWRQIAPPPDGVTAGVVLWTGTEMLVWREDRNPDRASAAYDPASDTWRLIADPPVPGSAAVWTGDAAVFLRDPDSPSSTSSSYDPATDEWRPLADGPWGAGVGWVVPPETNAVWTGTTLITMTDSEDGILLNGYDPATDTWRVLQGLDTGQQPVVIPGRNGAAATVAFLPLKIGTPVELFDSRGTAIGEWAGRPADLPLTCPTPPSNDSCFLTSLRAVSVGGEVLFWHSADGWTIDPEGQTWRSLPLDGRQPGYDGTEVVAAGDLLFAWGAGRDGLVYRAALPG